VTTGPPISYHPDVVRLLCISDIHGDEAALAAVLATAERRGFSRLLVAGDICFPGPAPLDTWRRVVRADAICVQGLGDRALATIDLDRIRAPQSDHERERLERLIEVRRELGEPILERIKRLPAQARMPLPDGGELVLVHGSPADPTEPFTAEMDDAEVSALIGDDPCDIIICGGSHVPFERTVGGVHIVNVGSVGEAICRGGHRHADATFVELSGGRLRVEQFAVPLDRAA
jgi:predicted phosphodiesterase